MPHFTCLLSLQMHGQHAEVTHAHHAWLQWLDIAHSGSTMSRPFRNVHAHVSDVIMECIDHPRLLRAMTLGALHTGVWIRDDQLTDLKAYERQLDVMQITGIKKNTALKFIKGLQLTEKPDGVTIQFLTAVPYFKVIFLSLDAQEPLLKPLIRKAKLTTCH